MGFYMIAYEEILGTVRSMHLAQEWAPLQINLVDAKSESFDWIQRYQGNAYSQKYQIQFLCPLSKFTRKRAVEVAVTQFYYKITIFLL